MRPEYLVCSPEYYEVNYVINPWMRPEVWQSEKAAWTAKSQHQWEKLIQAMQQIGWKIKTISSRPGLPDMVFTANHALVIGQKALVAQFAVPQRHGETALAESWFRSKGFETWVCPIPFEGAGDALYDPHLDIIFLGHGFRSKPEAAAEIQSFFGKKVVLLPLRDPRFYHLDTCFCPLETGQALFTPLAFSEDAERILRKYYGPNLVEIGPEDALQFACNAICDSHHIITPKVSARTTDILVDAGLTPYQLELDSFILAGGASKCLTLRLDHQ